MHFAPTDEQRQIQDSVARFVEKEYTFDARQKIAESEEGWSRENWATFAELGLLGFPFAEELGGFGGSMIDAGLIMEGFGKGVVVEPYVPTVVLGGTAMALAGRADMIEQIGAGAVQMALAYAEPQARYNLADVSLRAEKQGGGFVLSGHKCVVHNGDAADWLVISARTAGGQRDADGISLFLVPGDAGGISRRGYPTVDGGRAAEITFDGVKVGSEALLGEADAGLPMLEAVVDAGIAAICCEAAGIMEHIVATTQEYLKTREQFGVPLGKFQVLQHRMADMFADHQEAKSIAYLAAVCVAGGDPKERARAAAAAKNFIGRAGRRVGQDSIQMHGGMGMTWEMPVTSYFKRLTMIDTQFGDTDHHRTRLADIVLAA